VDREGYGQVGFRKGSFPEEHAVAVESRLPLKVCLLLRVGRADLAEVLWASGTGWKPDGPKFDLTNYGISYLTLAQEWAWYLFDRTLCAHMRGDDRIALAGARMLLTARTAIEAKANELGFPDRQAPSDQRRESTPYLEFLTQLSELAADQERRAKEPKRGPVPPPGTDRAARIAALIRDLDLVDERDSISGLLISESPIIQGLVKEGREAVEPLLSDLEHDTRLTRAVSLETEAWAWTSGHDPDFPRRTIEPVSLAAHVALSGILRTPDFSEKGYAEIRQGGDARRRRVAAIRDAWEKNKDLPLAERWYRTLADDRAKPDQWLFSAGNIVKPTDYHRRHGSGWTIVPPRPKPGEVVAPLEGDSLRGKTNPSVADLMAKRAIELTRSKAGQFPDLTLEREAHDMALILARWDRSAAIPVLHEQFQVGRELVAQTIAKGEQGRAPYLAVTLAALTEERVQDGDPKALADYADWLPTVPPTFLEFNTEKALEPMMRYPDDPAIVRASRRMFGEPASFWLPLVNDKDRGETSVSHKKAELLGSRLLGVAAFRARVNAELKDRTTIGIASVSDETTISVSVGERGPRTLHISADETGTKGKYPFRVCDFVASRLADRVDGTQSFKFYWPESRRDAAVAAIIAFLERYGARLAHTPQADELPSQLGPDRLQSVFPPLDHPATADDVRRGLAIFTLEGEGEARLAALPARPLPAKWVTLKDYPEQQELYSATGEHETRVVFDQDGLVWQAEEVRKNGRWDRFYGFAGRRLAKVPAAEIEFTENWIQWGLLTNRLDAQVGTGKAWNELSSMGKPVEVIVRLRNRAGLEQKVPSEYLRNEGLRRPTLRPGIALKVSYVADDPERRARTPLPPDLPTGEPLAPRAIDFFEPGDAVRTLGPAESFEAFRINLNDWFAIDRPGIYRVRVVFTKESGLAEGLSNEITIPIIAPPAH
jgi:hypothetical protein